MMMGDESFTQSHDPEVTDPRRLPQQHFPTQTNLSTISDVNESFRAECRKAAAVQEDSAEGGALQGHGAAPAECSNLIRTQIRRAKAPPTLKIPELFKVTYLYVTPKLHIASTGTPGFEWDVSTAYTVLIGSHGRKLKREIRVQVGSPWHFATARYPRRLGGALENERNRTRECNSVSLDGAHVFFYSGRSGTAQFGALRTRFLAALRRGRGQSSTAPHRTACAPRGRPAPHCRTATARKEGKRSILAVLQAAPHAGQQD